MCCESAFSYKTLDSFVLKFRFLAASFHHPIVKETTISEFYEHKRDEFEEFVSTVFDHFKISNDIKIEVMHVILKQPQKWRQSKNKQK